MTLQATHINLTLGQKSILRDVSLTAQAGEVTAIVGPNGSGKSSLLKVLVGEQPASGEVLLNGQTLTSYRPWELASLRGVLPQATVLAFPFTVLEVVRLGLAAGPDANHPDLPFEALAQVDLDGYAGRFYQELSGGEQQRVQLARVLAQVWRPLREGRPCWLFLDEPVSSLDIAHQLTVMEITRRFAQNGGGVIAVMHDLNLTAMYADRVQIMHAGQSAGAGPVPEILTDSRLSQVYGCPLRTSVVPQNAGVFVLPQAARQTAPAPPAA
ncbi:heme ABC transporter ATP-binding protein [Tritonibacter horizontis]|uniref:Hemin import ATP-binding protein HmuV n=1 Tax=Tritonibacter horizontis TaxID=1768241 RepID=A0A132BVX1_9RHOB|nr:heme ABC transporter ATP-binding protein [Tritonibacter horizontis]KUP91957.1 hemin import ATP-binding protein HmuV [Tritonibacter horizontis]